MPNFRTISAIIAIVPLAFTPSTVEAAFVVVSNATVETIRFDRVLLDGKTKSESLLSGESRPYSSGKTLDLVYQSEGKATPVKLNAYAAYVFVAKKAALDLRGIELAGAAPAVGDSPDSVTMAAELTVNVKIYVDETERRTRKTWQAAQRKRFEQAAEILKAHTGVNFELSGFDDWTTDPNVVDLKGLLGDFETQVKAAPGTICIGYTSRKFEAIGNETAKPLGFAVARSALRTHMMVRESEPRTEPERVEVLVQQLGRYLGAITSPDPNSAMRIRLGDGKATSARFRISFDPLNVLAMNIWADELRTGKVKKPGDLSAITQTRLGRIYGTLSVALPDVAVDADYLAMLERAGIAMETSVPNTPGVEGKPRTIPKVDKLLTPKEEAVRKVIAAIVVRATENSKLPATGAAGAKVRLKGDELTVAYVQTAATVALMADPEHRVSAFLLGIGLALDDSSILRDNPLTTSFCKTVESDDDRRIRLAMIGTPTIRYRRDWCQHFVVSAALTEFVGPQLAEKAGLIKEQLDMNGASGFSFADLCADFAGVEFANRLKATPKELEAVQTQFTIADYVPKTEDLREGISTERFRIDYGKFDEAKFKTAYDEIWKRVKSLPKYQENK